MEVRYKIFFCTFEAFLLLTMGVFTGTSAFATFQLDKPQVPPPQLEEPDVQPPLGKQPKPILVCENAPFILVILDRPIDIAVDPKTCDVFVADTGNHRIQKFSNSGGFITKWGTKGSGNGQFHHPYGIAVDPKTGNVFVTEPNIYRIQKFLLATPCPQGTTQVVPGVCFVTKWGSKGTANGQFNSPHGIDVDPNNGNVFVADTFNHRIQKFRLATPCPQGTTQVVPGVCFITKWGTAKFMVPQPQ